MDQLSLILVLLRSCLDSFGGAKRVILRGVCMSLSGPVWIQNWAATKASVGARLSMHPSVHLCSISSCPACFEKELVIFIFYFFVYFHFLDILKKDLFVFSCHWRFILLFCARCFISLSGGFDEIELQEVCP